MRNAYQQLASLVFRSYWIQFWLGLAWEAYEALSDPLVVVERSLKYPWKVAWKSLNSKVAEEWVPCDWLKYVAGVGGTSFPNVHRVYHRLRTQLCQCYCDSFCFQFTSNRCDFPDCRRLAMVLESSVCQNWFLKCKILLRCLTGSVGAQTELHYSVVRSCYRNIHKWKSSVNQPFRIRLRAGTGHIQSWTKIAYIFTWDM